MRSKQARPWPRRRLAWAGATAGLVAITAVAASSMAGATPFIPAVPDGNSRAGGSSMDGSAKLADVDFPLLYASEGSSGSGSCEPPGVTTCQTRAELFTLTKHVDNTTPVLAQDAATGKPFSTAVITLRRAEKGEQKALITYTLKNVRVIDDHQVWDNSSPSAPIREVVTLSYATITWAVGATKAGYDWETRKKT